MQATQMVLLEGLKTYNSSFTGLLSLTGVDGSCHYTHLPTSLPAVFLLMWMAPARVHIVVGAMLEGTT